MNVYAPLESAVPRSNGARPVQAQPQAAADRSFRGFFQAHAATVAIVTAADAGQCAGITVTTVSPLMETPPSLIVSLDRESRTAQMIVRSRRFGVNVLHEGQRDIAGAFTRRASALADVERIVGDAGPWVSGPSGLPLLVDCLGTAVCDVFQSYAFDTQIVFIGTMQDMSIGDRQPLVRRQGRFCRVAP